MSCRSARCRIRCQVRSRPPLSSGRRRSDLSQRMRMVASGRARQAPGKRLDTVVVDECPIPELEVQQAPDPIARVDLGTRVIAKQTIDGRWIDDPALA